ncbi:outer membrane lipoprotein carrier protein LolA [Streptomyces sp. NPDC008079]|uniref:LolA family protein n=1 Tax=unclassified Streptomyces TaxID=2593676 RepID=UPI0036E1B32E
MARIQPAQFPEHPESDEPGRGRGRKAMRYAVPVAVAGVAAATISLVPALADTGSPSLPTLTAEQLLTKVAASDTQTVSGSVKVSTDLGLPDVLSGGAASSLFGGAASAAGPSGKDGKGSAAAPQAQLTQLLAGSHTLHVAADGPDRQKVSIIEPTAEYSLIHNGTEVWGYDSGSNEAYHATAPADAKGGADSRARSQDFPATPQAAAQQVLKAADGTASVTVDGTARVAGHSAYQLLVTPQHADKTTVGAIRIAVDSKTGVPLKFTLSPKGGGKAIVDIGFTKVSFGKPSASTFTFTPPKGTKVTEAGKESDAVTKGQKGFDGVTGLPGFDGVNGTGHTSGGEPTVIGKGWDSIAVITSPGGLPSGADKNAHGKGGGDAQSLLNSFGRHVTGDFGSGTVFHTRLVNALLTDKGTLYVGAVTQSALMDAANAANAANAAK